MKKICFLIVFLSTIISSAQTPTKEEAKQAFLEIMKTLMKNDCHAWLNYFNDTIKIISPFDTVISSNAIKNNEENICSKIKQDFEGNYDTMWEQYINQVELVVYNRAEFSDTSTLMKYRYKSDLMGMQNKFILGCLVSAPKYYTDEDFLVLGYIAKNKDFVKPMGRDGWYYYVLRKTKLGWKIFGLGH